jgi:uncharacterized protein YcfJ
MQMKSKLALGALALMAALPAAGQITFYTGDGFRGEVFRANGPIANLDRSGYNDRFSSVIVERGRWEVCEHAGFAGRCAVLRPGSYESLAPFGLSNTISSVRPAGRRPEHVAEIPPPPAPVPVYEYRRRPAERLYEAQVVSVRAVMGPPEQRCWVERQQVVEDRPNQANVPGAIIGGIIGGVLGHQVGGGRGRDVATVGGAIAGTAIGANVNRGGQAVYNRDVQRCSDVPNSARPSYWDVTYVFNGVEHYAQLSAPPGPTITVNQRGEPRG